MPLFGSGTLFDAEVEKVTSENNISEDWGQILDICDKVSITPNGPKECLRAIIKRLNNPVPHVVLHSLTLLDACINNCGKPFHLEVCSREFEAELKKLLSKAHPKAVEKLKILIKKWAEEDFKNDPQLSLIPSLYSKLKSDGIDFSPSEMPKATITAALPKDPNVVTSQQEEDDIAKAIELSLKENESGKSGGGSSLYPSARSSSPNNSSPYHTESNGKEKEAKKVRALYDFEAAEDNELTFKAGEIILVLDSSDPNWWKGSNHLGEGLFPANFVTSDLEAEPEPVKVEKKVVQFNEEVKVKTLEGIPLGQVEIDEEKIDRVLHMMHEADPTGEMSDDEDLLALEENCNAQSPLIDQELEKIDRSHAALTNLNQRLVDALNMYHGLMKESFRMPPPPQQSPLPPPQGQYNPYIPPGVIPPNMPNMRGPPMPHYNNAPPTQNVGYSIPQYGGVPPHEQQQHHFGGGQPQFGGPLKREGVVEYPQQQGANPQGHVGTPQQPQRDQNFSPPNVQNQQNEPNTSMGGGNFITSPTSHQGLFSSMGAQFQGNFGGMVPGGGAVNLGPVFSNNNPMPNHHGVTMGSIHGGHVPTSNFSPTAHSIKQQPLL